MMEHHFSSSSLAFALRSAFVATCCRRASITSMNSCWLRSCFMRSFCSYICAFARSIAAARISSW